MSIYAIGDLHLAQSIDKPMDIFGVKWLNYMEQIKESWGKKITDADTVIIPGDISWATYLEEAVLDFKFIDLLPGRKIILKGNHDYWWTTMTKLESFLKENNFNTLEFLQNNSFEIENNYLCGTRGWKCPGDDDFSDEDKKIYERELQRLELSLKSIEKKQGKKPDIKSSIKSGKKSDEESDYSCDTDLNNCADKDIIVALHYPPFNSKWEPSEFIEIMKKHFVKTCIYGHIHGDAYKNAFQGDLDGVSFRLVSSDYLKFEPLKLV
ncbi:MAG: metallophosphoesterase [Clostridia bacterium]|jgi:hypothetical protein